MKNFEKSTASPFALTVVAHGSVLTGPPTARGRSRTSIAPMAAVKGSALLPISDVVEFDGLAGIRSWSPPV